jgi:hypothetical protein
VFGILAEPDAGNLQPERQPCPEHLIVVPRNIGHLSATTRVSQDEAEHLVVRFIPIPGFSQPPSIDDVTDEEEMLAGVAAEKIRQKLAPATTGAKMRIGYKDCSIIRRTIVV